DIHYTITDGKLYFVANSNGDYVIQIKDTKETISIDKIDKEAPTLLDTNYQDKKLSLSLNDNLSGIDYNTSYVEYQNQQYTIDTNGIVEGEFNDNILVCIYDYTGNFMKYSVALSNLEQ
ncbi:MAG: hypothetical protein ACK5LC_08945, partial [Coprobacillaceae bacterium]